MQQALAKSIGELADNVLRLSSEGFDTYFACSSFNGIPLHVAKGDRVDVKYRTAEQVVATKAFWLDLDCGPGKPYADADAAAEDLWAWCDEYSIPEPTIVYSGAGVHAYWALERPLTPQEWHPLALRFKVFCASTEFAADETRTADMASVLRPPATLNYKRATPAPVLLSDLQPAIAVERFAAFLPQVDVLLRTTARTALAQGLDEFTNIYAEVPSDPAQIAAGCQWLRAVGPIAKGNVAEPLWYAMLGLLIYAANGEDIAHEWSWGHPEYDYDATEDKMEQARRNQTGPTTCARFESQWHAGCKGCPHRGKITTPLQLGRPQPVTRETLAALAYSPPQASFGVDLGTTNEKAAAFDTGAMIALPYFWQPDGSLAQSVLLAEDVSVIVREIYAYPLFIESMRRGEISGVAYALLRHWAPYDGWQHLNIPAGDLTAEGAFRALGNAHIEVGPNVQKSFQLFLSQIKQVYKESRQTEVQHETFGWKEDGFLVGDVLIHKGALGKVGISEELKKYASKMGAAGTLAAWSGAAQQLFLPGYEHQALSLLAGLASTLMRFAPYPGAIYSMVSDKSGRGKTFAVEAATSIWGTDKVLWVSHRDEKVSAGDTIKAQYRVMSLLKSLPIVVDELRDNDPEKLRSFILAFTDGAPRKGLNRDGSLRDTFGDWKTIMQVTSNKSIVDIVTVSNDPAAANRVFEVTATLPEDANPAAAAEIKRAMTKNYGHAGITFVQALLDPANQDWAEYEVQRLVDRYTVELGLVRSDRGGGDRYIASFLACCVVAGQLATRIGLFQCDTQHILDWAYERWGRQSSQIEQSHRSSVESLSAFLREHWDNALVVQDEVRGRETTVPVRDLRRAPLLLRIEQKSGKIFLDRAAFQRWCLTENLHFLGIGDDLARQGILLDRNIARNLGAGTDYARNGQSKLWLIDSRHPLMSGELREQMELPLTEPVQMKGGGR